MTQVMEVASDWCRSELDSAIDELLFATGFSTDVFGVRLRDGREVVLKFRPFVRRLLGAAAVHRHLWKAGFPCPRPLAGPVPLGGQWISAELLVAGGSVLQDSPQAPDLYACALADLIRLAPASEAVPRLDAPPPWAHWDHSERGLWPRHDRLDVDLNADTDPDWLQEAARRVRTRLTRFVGPRVVGHADWWSHNLRWVGRRLHVVFDWDSVAAQPEPILVGEAAYMFAKTSFELDGCAPGASVDDTKRFLAAYEQAQGRAWSADERQTAWAASLWVALYDARLSRVEDRGQGFADLVHRDASRRLDLAGA